MGALTVVNKFKQEYIKSVPKKIKIIDSYLIYIFITGVSQFVYCGLVGTFPFNSFLSGFVSTVSSFVLADSIEEVMEKEKSGPRKTFPNKKYADTSSSTLSDSNSSEQEPKETKQQTHKRVRSNRLENIIKQVKQKNNNLFFEDDSESASENETTCMKQKRSRTEIDILTTTNPLDTEPSTLHPPSSTTKAAQVPDSALQSQQLMPATTSRHTLRVGDKPYDYGDNAAHDTYFAETDRNDAYISQLLHQQVDKYYVQMMASIIEILTMMSLIGHQVVYSKTMN